MDPITAAIAIAGMGVQLFGASQSASATSQMADLSSKEAGLSQDVTRLQGQENDQRRLAMQISARRQQTEIIRKTQMAQAQGLATGVSQGAQFGSGVAGGQAQARGEGAYNLEGVNQNLGIGESLFGLQGQITGKQVAMSGLQSQMASLQGKASTGSGISAIGGSLSNSAGPLGSILGNFFGNKSDPSNPIENRQNSLGFSVGGA